MEAHLPFQWLLAKNPPHLNRERRDHRESLTLLIWSSYSFLSSPGWHTRGLEISTGEGKRKRLINVICIAMKQFCSTSSSAYQHHHNHQFPALSARTGRGKRPVCVSTAQCWPRSCSGRSVVPTWTHAFGKADSTCWTCPRFPESRVCRTCACREEWPAPGICPDRLDRGSLSVPDPQSFPQPDPCPLQTQAAFCGRPLGVSQWGLSLSQLLQQHMTVSWKTKTTWKPDLKHCITMTCTTLHPGFPPPKHSCSFCKEKLYKT